MGWLYFHLEEKPKDWFVNHVNCQYFEVLKVAIVNTRELYAAVKEKKTGQVICFVYMLDWDNTTWMNFGYKDLTEFDGPYYFNCPESIFKLLTPLNDETDESGRARKWREEVKKRIDARKSVKGNGIFKTMTPVRFTNGMEFQYFQKVGRDIIAGSMTEDNFSGRVRVKLNLSKVKAERVN